MSLNEYKEQLIVQRFAPRPNPTPIPAPGVFDEPAICVSINRKWVSHILGALETLDQPDTWIGTQAEIDDARQQVRLLMDAIAIGNCTGGDVALTDIRIVSTGLEKTFDGGLTWIPVGTVGEDGIDGEDGLPGSDGDAGSDGASAQLRKTSTAIQWRQDDDNPTWADLVLLSEITGAAGAAGSPGATGAAGAPGADGQDCDDCAPGQPPAEETVTNDEESLCAGAVGLTDWLLDVLDSSIDEVSGIGSGTTTVATASLQILKIVFDTAKAIPIAGIVVSFIDSVIASGIGLVDAQLNDPDYREEAFCSLYCKAKEAGGFNETVFIAWLNDLPAVAASAQFDDMARRIIGYAACSQRFAIYATGSSVECALCTDCDECPPGLDWCKTFDFTTSNQSAYWSVVQDVGGFQVVGVYTAGVGYEDKLCTRTVYPDLFRGVFISATLPGGNGTLYTYAKAELQITFGSSTTSTLTVNFSAGSLVLGEFSQNSPQTSIEWTGSEFINAAGRNFTLACQAGYDGVAPITDPGGTVTITRITVGGTGIDPFPT